MSLPAANDWTPDMATKADKKRKIRRLLDMEKLLAIGISSREVQIKFAAEYGITERQIRKDVLQIQEKWAKEAESEGKTDLRRNQTRQLLRAIARAAMASKKYSAAVAAANRLMELDGLKVIRIEHKGTIEHKSAKDSLSDILDGIASRQGAGGVVGEPH